MCSECRDEDDFLEEEPVAFDLSKMIPGLDVAEIQKKTEAAEKRSVDQHLEQKQLLTEIRDALREVVKALKGE